MNIVLESMCVSVSLGHLQIIFTHLFNNYILEVLLLVALGPSLHLKKVSYGSAFLCPLPSMPSAAVPHPVLGCSYVFDFPMEAGCNRYNPN